MTMPRIGRLVVVLLAASPLGSRAAVTSLTVFGDSLSDTGTIAALLDALGQPSVTPPPYYEGRFSNGPVYAERLGFPVEPAFQFGGSNYAVGGALTATHVGGPLLAGLSLAGQIDFFRERNGGAADPDSLFIVWIGGNDVREAAMGGDPAAGASIIGAALEVVEMTLLDLRSMGARQFVVPNLPDFGRTPEFAAAADPGLATMLSEQWNGGLAEVVAGSGGDGATLVDANEFFDRILDDPAAYGFSNITDQALLHLDQDADEFVFWDEIHPTARVHALFAEELRCRHSRAGKRDARRAEWRRWSAATAQTLNEVE